MPTSVNSGMKTIALYVSRNYPFSGKELKAGIDRLFPKIWDYLSAAEQNAINEECSREIDMLDWRDPAHD